MAVKRVDEGQDAAREHGTCRSSDSCKSPQRTGPVIEFETKRNLSCSSMNMDVRTRLGVCILGLVAVIGAASVRFLEGEIFPASEIIQVADRRFAIRPVEQNAADDFD